MSQFKASTSSNDSSKASHPGQNASLRYKCSECGKLKTCDFFSRDARKKIDEGKLSTAICTVCKSVMNNAHVRKKEETYDQFKERMRHLEEKRTGGLKELKCSECEKVRPSERFSNKDLRNYKQGLPAMCNVCKSVVNMPRLDEDDSVDEDFFDCSPGNDRYRVCNCYDDDDCMMCDDYNPYQNVMNCLAEYAHRKTAQGSSQ